MHDERQAAIQIVRNRALNLRSAAQREIDAVLKRQALDRTGTRDVMEPVFAPLLSQLESGKGAFAVADLLVKDSLTRMAHTFSMPFPDPASRPLGHALG
jgi:hypothetical protein